ncbi:ATP-binding protein [Nonomuraea sp. NPDC023979]|uniref:ATP-binding protein n=1 Tax=Nonomuraea sp. NPDC023979 TaxID=3154796 RepID=UPI003403434A
MGHSATAPPLLAAGGAASPADGITSRARLSGGLSSVPTARAFTTAFIRRTALIGWPRVGDLLSCVSEMVSNALFHSRSGQQGHFIVVHLQIESGMLTATVLDEGEPDAPLPPRLVDDTGFGLMLISALCDDYSVTSTPSGRRSSCRFQLDSSPATTSASGYPPC